MGEHLACLVTVTRQAGCFSGKEYARHTICFHDGSWNRGFDHAEAFAKIECPALLIHANSTTQEDGTLNGAIDQEGADRIVAPIPNAQYIRVDAGHVIHLDEPKQHISIVEAFFDGK